MEWFIVIVFAAFIGGLIWISVEAIRHADKRQSPNKANSSDTHTSRG